MQNRYTLLILFITLMMSTNTLATSRSEQEANYPQDTVCLNIDKWKYIQAWAEYGLKCKSESELLHEQIKRDAKRVERMYKELEGERKKNKNLKIGLSILGGIALVELLIIIAL